MRNDYSPRENGKRSDQGSASVHEMNAGGLLPGNQPAPVVVRVFTPSLNLDDLVEAVRLMLGPTESQTKGPSTHPSPDLLSLPRRVSCVVKA